MISTADWDHPFWTNKQHVAKSLATMGHEVLYVESLGIRPFSRESVNDSGRVLKRLKRFIKPPREVSARVTVASPLVLPLWSNKRAVFFNRILMKIQVLMWRLFWGRWDVVWTYSPITTAALNLSSTPVLYHCVDNIAAQPTMPSATIDAYERELLKRADVIYSTAPELTERLLAMGAKEVVEHTNVVDFEHFVTVKRDATTRSERVIGFVGAISSYKVDLKLLGLVAKHFPDCQIILVGQVGEGQPGETLADLERYPNIRLLGPRTYEDLPAVLATFDAAILPVPINDYTKSMFPMKFFEYLAAGVPVVATAIPSLIKFGDFAFISDSNEAFLGNISRALAVSEEWRAEGRSLASRYTYQKRTSNMVEAVEDLIRAAGG